jgi:hypothetical protein
MLLTDAYGIVPGLTTSRETYEAEFRWGSQFQGVFANALIDGATVDTGNSPTYELRPGLLLGQNLTTGKYKQYSPTATDGTEVAAGVLIEALRMQDFTGNNVDRFYAVLVGGPVQAAKILGLDLNARQCMDKFIFDDLFNLPGNHWFPWKRFQTKTANYTAVATDNFTLFDNTGANGEVDITLPAIANGYNFAIKATATQTFKLISNEGGNIIGDTNTRSNVSVAAIGGGIEVFTNAAGTKWQVVNISSGTQTVTFA